MQPGRRNRRITFQKYETTLTDEGYQVKQWVDMCTVWASFRTYNNKEKMQSNTLHDKQTCEINIRYMKNINFAQRIKYKDCYYNILSVSNVNEQDQEIILLCEVITDGSNV